MISLATFASSGRDRPVVSDGRGLGQAHPSGVPKAGDSVVRRGEFQRIDGIRMPGELESESPLLTDAHDAPRRPGFPQPALCHSDTFSLGFSSGSMRPLATFVPQIDFGGVTCCALQEVSVTRDERVARVSGPTDLRLKLTCSLSRKRHARARFPHLQPAPYSGAVRMGLPRHYRAPSTTPR